MRAVGAGLFAAPAWMALSGCSSLGEWKEAAAAALRFEESLRGAQTLPGCDGLAPGTREELEETADSLRPAALAELELPSADEGRRVDVYGHRARVVLDAGTLFLSAFRDGWKAVAGHADFNNRLVAESLQSVTFWGCLHTSDFAVDVTGNGQSELLAVASVVILSVYLRQRGSPESKPVGAPHRATDIGG